MIDERTRAQLRVRDLKAREAHEKELARSLPPGAARDEHWMRGERLSDEAWSIEERYDIEITPSGLWR